MSFLNDVRFAVRSLQQTMRLAPAARVDVMQALHSE